MSFQMFSQDGLDTIFWGFVLLLVGSLMSVLAIVHIAFAIVGAIMALIGAGVLYLKTRRGRRNGNNNGRGPKPGQAPECQAHRDKLIELDTEQKNTKELLSEVRTDVKTLLQRIPPKE